MKCDRCGQEIPDNAAFCPMCGTPVPPQDMTVDAQESPSVSTHQPNTHPAYSKGSLRAAWHDVCTSASIGKLLLLALLHCIPIVDFFMRGYALNWSREVPYGGRTRFPKHILTVNNFKIGFFLFLIMVVFMIVCNLVVYLVTFVPVIGALLALVAYVLYYLFLYLSGLRMAMSQRLGEGFAIGKLWRAMWRKWTDIFCVTILPALIVGIIEIALVLVILFAFLGSSWWLIILSAFVEIAQGDTSSATVLIESLIDSQSLAFWVSFFVVLVIGAYVGALLEVIADLISFRGTGHYIGRYVQEWTREFPGSFESSTFVNR